MIRPLTKAEIDCAWVAFAANAPCIGTTWQAECWIMMLEELEGRNSQSYDARHTMTLAECRKSVEEHRKWVDG